MPRGFAITRVEHDGTGFRLVGADGRVAAGTPEQFTRHPKLLPAAHNPAYDEQLLQLLLATGSLPGRVRLSLDAADWAAALGLLPHTRRLVRRLPELFAAAFAASELVVYRTGDFELHLTDRSTRYFEDGYWPCVLFTADGTPRRVTVEA